GAVRVVASIAGRWRRAGRHRGHRGRIRRLSGPDASEPSDGLTNGCRAHRGCSRNRIGVPDRIQVLKGDFAERMRNRSSFTGMAVFKARTLFRATLFSLLAASAVLAQPKITAVLDAAAYTSGIAEGGVFVVKGSNLCPSGVVFGTIPYSSAPLNHVKIT